LTQISEKGGGGGQIPMGVKAKKPAVACRFFGFMEKEKIRVVC
jgi:hypothetical protein